MKNGLAKRCVAAAVMCGGMSLVFGGLLLMNARTVPPVTRSQAAGRRLVIQRPPPRVEREVTPPRRRMRPRPRRPIAPRPQLNQALSGIRFDLPSLQAASLERATKDLAGAARGLEDVVMSAKSVDVPPRPQQRHAPVYPPRARTQGIVGYVRLRLKIGRRGEVLDVRVTAAKPAETFDQAAIEAVRKWRFSPARYRGEAVKTWAQLTLRFDLG